MIDTIVLRVHDVRKNTSLVKALYTYTPKTMETASLQVSLEDLLEQFRKGEKDATVLMRILKLKDTSKRAGGYIIKTEIGKHINLSSHYTLTFHINWTRDFIEFNFSIPKYKFGTNVLMFTRHNTDRGFLMYDANILDINLRNSYDLLIRFIPRFFKYEFTSSKVDLKDVEINRIDLCFNQIFKSADEALKYLEYQKRMKKKYARDEQGTMRDYSTSLMYVTNRYSVKIYHKGTEYQKNDAKEHLKFNIEKKSNYFNIDELQNLADKTLRYEITVRANFLNYLHKQSIFRKKCPIWRGFYKKYCLVEFSKNYNDRVSKRIGKIKNPQEANDYRKKHPYIIPTADQKQAHKIVSIVLGKQTKFMLDTDLNTEMYNQRTVPTIVDRALFSRALFELCCKKFLDFIKQFQPRALSSEQAVIAKIELHNLANPRSKLPTNEMLFFYQQLLKHGSFKAVAKYCRYSKATLYRYITRFKKIGIDEQCLAPAENTYSIPEAPLDLRRYHRAVNEFQLLKRLPTNEVTRI